MVMLAPEAHGKNLDLVALVYQDVPDNIMGDPLRVKQVITNLVNNAIKFTQTGEVVLRASLEDEDPDNQRATLRLSVADSGVGLSRAQQHSLFNAFSQADPSTARQYGGTGLGLAISKRLVEEMGGEIGLNSELGKGSTFWFTLNPELSTLSNNEAPRDALKGERVIYLEHQKTTGLAVEHILRGWGITVDRVETPAELLSQVEQAQADQKGYAIAMVGITRPLLHSNQYRGLIHTLEADRDCRTLLLTPTLDTQETPFSGIPSSHLSKPVRRDALYDELLLLIHGIDTREPTPQSPTLALPGSRNNTPRILAVDDNEANLKLVLTLLEECELKAWGATSGFEALVLARQMPFDLVLMDLQMPGMDGVETTARIRELDREPHHTSIIALTAHAMASEQAQLRQQGFDGYMPKPISSRQLKALVHEYTGHEVPRSPAQESITEVRDTRSTPRPSSRRMQEGCVSIEESIQLAAGKPDLAEELFSMLLEQLPTDQHQIHNLWRDNDMDNLLECVHKLHGATRYCGVPELRTATYRFETALKHESKDMAEHRDQLLSAIERLLAWSEKTDWQMLFRKQHPQPETS
jgi:two-component system sensor histidine kinase BarA